MPQLPYKILTITHKTASLSQIAEFALLPTDSVLLSSELQRIKAAFGFEELIYVSTCNRVIYLFTGNITLNPAFVKRFFSCINCGITEETLEETENLVAVYESGEAVQHWYRVISSIDSLVVGEREILRQVRESYQQCLEWGLTGDHTRLLMRFSVEAAKAVYTHTRLGDKPVSVVSLAVQQLRQAIILSQPRFLIVGAGQTNRLFCKFLEQFEGAKVTITNRTYNKALELAQNVNGTAIPWTDLSENAPDFDILVTCVGTTEAIFDKNTYTKLISKNPTTRKAVVDLAVPNNLTKDVVESFPITYIDVEALKKLAEANLAFREAEVQKAEALLTQHLADFRKNYMHRQLERSFSSLPKQIKEIRHRAVTDIFGKEIELLPEDTRILVDNLLDYLERGAINTSMILAKQSFKD